METAKDILEKHGLHQLPADEVSDIIYAMREIADKAWSASWTRFRQEEYGRVPATAPDKSTFMKELFPESKTEQ